MFGTILIANRGEIAVRIIQTCREMGIETVAVYSDADRDSLHARRADRAFRLGPAPALESYLCGEAVIKAALQGGVDAVHPGYGFLAENAAFALAVGAAGLRWIGPSPDVIALMGDKVAAKAQAEAAGLPVVPGYYGDDQSGDRMLAEAQRIGFPVMLKAAAGGGGRGMRAVHDPAELPDAIEGAQREAHAGFGDDRLFLERLIARPRHVEMQVLADTHGNALYLGERDCSIQRRHQKVVEEAPSPVLTADLRRDMGRAALRLVRATNYTNAGTVEFLFSSDQYYFLEMNTRIQVEHPVTEMVTGLDLIRLQIEIAAGKTVRLSQLDIHMEGHAIEARVYAEDPDAGFLPSPGEIERFRAPMGAGIRNDVGVADGSQITSHYDSMLSKVIVHASTRAEAVTRLKTALSRYAVVGVTTNIDFLRWIMEQEDFVRGRATTDFLDRLWWPREPSPAPAQALALSACFEALEARDTSDVISPWSRTNTWRGVGSARVFAYEVGGESHVVTVKTAASTIFVGVDDREVFVFRQASGGGPNTLLDSDGRIVPLNVCRLHGGLEVRFNGEAYLIAYPRNEDGAHGGTGRDGAADALLAPMPGTVVKVAVKEGQRVQAFEPLVILEAMKMEHVIQAPHNGTVTSILYQVGDMVPGGAPVVRLEAE